MFLQAVGLALLGLVVAVFLVRPFWPRIVRYFQRWIERDRLIETQERQERECRQEAERELQVYCGDEAANHTGEAPAVQTVGRQTDGKQESDAS